ncbi:MAG: tRNA pseudouridine(38-40) synthase TruA [Bacteroidales bacterium]
MHRYFMEIAYDGRNYHGWQIQPNAKTVQEVLEEALSRLSGSAISVTGCGRTDTGVHATSFFLHFDMAEKIDDSDKLQYRLNGILPRDIAVYRIFPVAANAHARFDAISRSYRYLLHQVKNPFLRDRSWYHPVPLDINAMNLACTFLYDYKDFTSFSKLHTDTKTNDCKIIHAGWKYDDNQLIFEISADRFLRNMVRSIVGSLTDIGKGRYEASHMKTIIQAKDRSAAGQSVPAHALYLDRIVYSSSLSDI